ncbi:hypothetical protein L226DRAFT_561547 [Lentinus tigrinus ALCF2SS1-7]|uniref:Protein kinase domain-containing protein n=1 Tax=Lentinus tigrinus ALCF2SS1-6 TaxID=1328759 RepID=A0A5C2S5N1_9APHY|nr:hypothetical protein L227DRAFT_193628 [Lentinus tigrinus ALCF2SS1-6]RPD72877.1 hypothetical protein L226DRAFT_561547 [Lentinus tigrinus ALCF2SS1-7]
MSAHYGSTFGPPKWLNEHPELRSRGIELAAPLKPFCAWKTHCSPWSPNYVVKVVPPGCEEVEIYEQLHRLSPASPNHTLPCDVISSGTQQPFLIMPFVDKILDYADNSKWDLILMLDTFRQVLEGIEFLHHLNIAHMDMYDGQVLVADERLAGVHKKLEAGKVYIIDFDASKRLERGPGHQHAIELPRCNCKPPLDMTRFDPYSWDVYCTGKMFDHTVKWSYSDRPLPWIVRRYIDWLIGDERGCTTVCRCRPSARRARQVLSVIIYWTRIWGQCANLVARGRSLRRTETRPT